MESLRRVVANFPTSDFYITINFHPRSNDYHVKTSLVLSGRTLFTGERDEHSYPAFERCISKMVNKVNAYKSQLSNTPEISKHQKGTHQEILPTQEPDAATLEAAIDDGDYRQFRMATFGYEEAVRKRVGRWISRYPEIDALIGDRLQITDIVEDVFLTAFEEYPRRPQNVRFGEWLEELIDLTLKQLIRNPDEELENIKFAQTFSEAPPPAE